MGEGNDHVTVTGSRLVGTLVRAQGAARAASGATSGLASFTDEAIHGLWSGTFGRAKLEVPARLMTISRPPDGPISVTGRIFTPEGKPVGSLRRSIELIDLGKIEVTHESLGVGVQRSGFGTALNRQAFDGYERLGVQRVNVQAESDGAVAWALPQPNGRAFELYASGLSAAERIRDRSAFIWESAQSAHRTGRISDAEYGAMLPRMHNPAHPRAVAAGDIRDLHSLRAYDNEVVGAGTPDGILRRVMKGTSWSGVMELGRPIGIA